MEDLNGSSVVQDKDLGTSWSETSLRLMESTQEDPSRDNGPLQCEAVICCAGGASQSSIGVFSSNWGSPELSSSVQLRRSECARMNQSQCGDMTVPGSSGPVLRELQSGQLGEMSRDGLKTGTTSTTLQNKTQENH